MEDVNVCWIMLEKVVDCFEIDLGSDFEGEEFMEEFYESNFVWRFCFVLVFEVFKMVL